MNRTYTEEWDFRNSNVKEYTHVYHAYPAMMIPQIARKLIGEYYPSGRMNLIFDPYMGSGTTLIEAKICGINAVGTDINPLARLIADTKTKNFNSDRIRGIINYLKEKISDYKPDYCFEINNITNWEFWYNKDRISELLFLTNLIKDDFIEEVNKNFFNIALSECVREVSYTRNGEFKRYRIEQSKIEDFKPNTFKLFIEKLERNLLGLVELNETNNDDICGVYDFNTVNQIPDNIVDNESVDMIITSPPYGDSKTTVAYGQFSRWANEWFGFKNARDLDTLLMGGRKLKEYTFTSKAISSELQQIRELDKKRFAEVMDFLDEYYRSIRNVAHKVRKGGRACYIVGNRNVKGVQIPLDYFTVEAFENFGFSHINTFVRGISNKRMPSKTSPTNVKGKNVGTMMNEYIIIMEKK